jgi:type II secretory pathway pseudopilin PulG
MNFKKNKERGQSLIELMVALGIFILIVGSLAIFILEGYVSGRLAQEKTVANFLAEEGLEAARSIRDNKWSSLKNGNYGLEISGDKNWVFSGISEDLSSQFKQGATRTITIEDAGVCRKKITSRVGWEFTGNIYQDVELITYLTNWEASLPQVNQNHYRWRSDNGLE